MANFEQPKNNRAQQEATPHALDSNPIKGAIFNTRRDGLYQTVGPAQIFRTVEA